MMLSKKEQPFFARLARLGKANHGEKQNHAKKNKAKWIFL